MSGWDVGLIKMTKEDPDSKFVLAVGKKMFGRCSFSLVEMHPLLESRIPSRWFHVFPPKDICSKDTVLGRSTFGHKIVRPKANFGRPRDIWSQIIDENIFGENPFAEKTFGWQTFGSSNDKKIKYSSSKKTVHRKRPFIKKDRS
jgi:hypothetical protein